MACCSRAQGTADERTRSEAIDRALAAEKTKGANEAKVLLLGAGESGKSTIFRQVKVIHQQGYTTAELVNEKEHIFANIHFSIHNICTFIAKQGLAYSSPEAEVCLFVAFAFVSCVCCWFVFALFVSLVVFGSFIVRPHSFAFSLC